MLYFVRLFSRINKMDNITDFKIVPLAKDALNTFTMHYTQDGKYKTWDLLVIDDTVVALIYNTTRNVLLFLKQFRPPVYYSSVPQEDRKDSIDTEKYPGQLGITVELCTKTVTNQNSILDDIKEQIRNTFGYSVASSQIQKIASYRSGVGTTGAKETAFYCEVTDDMKTGDTVSTDGIIEIAEMSPTDARKYVEQKYIRSPPNFLFAVHWFLYTKVNKTQN